MSMRVNYWVSDDSDRKWFDCYIGVDETTIELMHCLKVTTLSMARDKIEHGSSPDIGSAISLLKFADDIDKAISNACEDMKNDESGNGRSDENA